MINIEFVTTWKKRWLAYTLSELLQKSSREILFKKIKEKILNKLNLNKTIVYNFGRCYTIGYNQNIKTDYLIQVYLNECKKAMRFETKLLKQIVSDTILHESLHVALEKCELNTEENCEKSFELIKKRKYEDYDLMDVFNLEGN